MTPPPQPEQPLPDIHCPFSRGDVCPVREAAVIVQRAERSAKALDNGGLRAFARAVLQNRVIAAAPTAGQLTRAQRNLDVTGSPGCFGSFRDTSYVRLGGWSIALRSRQACGHQKLRQAG